MVNEHYQFRNTDRDRNGHYRAMSFLTNKETQDAITSKHILSMMLEPDEDDPEDFVNTLHELSTRDEKVS